MREELYADGIGEITVTGSIVRIDLVSLSPVEKDENNTPKPVLRQRIIMPVDSFANAVELMRKAMGGLVEAGAIRKIGPVSEKQGEPAVLKGAVEPAAARREPNASPNFN